MVANENWARFRGTATINRGIGVGAAGTGHTIGCGLRSELGELFSPSLAPAVLFPWDRAPSSTSRCLAATLPLAVGRWEN